jgi:hypothetical protein
VGVAARALGALTIDRASITNRDVAEAAARVKKPLITASFE